MRYFLRIKENIIKDKNQTLSTLDTINTNESKKIKEYDDMPYLETEEEAAEKIADINERRDARKKDNKARTFAPPDNAEKVKQIKQKKVVNDSNKDDDDDKNITIFYDDDDDVIKIFYGGNEDIKILPDDNKNIEIFYSNDYKINGLDENGLNENGYNINGIKGTKKKNPNINIKFKRAKNGILYDQYGFDKDGFNKDGYNMYGFNKNGLNKNGFNICGYNAKLNKIKIYKRKYFEDQKRKEYIDVPILLSKMYTNNNSEELETNIKNLLNHPFDNKQITKQVYNILNKAITYKNDS